MKKNKKQITIEKVEDLPAQKLFEMAQEKNQQMIDEEAGYYYQLAYKKDPNNDLIVLCYAEFLKSNNEIENAKTILTKSLQNKPKGSYKRYFQLAELYDGVESIEIFQRGIKVASTFNLQYQKQIRRDIANAYAAIAEVCMTDLIDVKQAEGKCTQSLKKGEQIDETSMDIHLQTANYLLFKQQQQSAKQRLILIYKNIKQQSQQTELYSDELKIQTARYLIQVKCFQEASEIITQLNQTGKDIQLQYLLAYCYFNLKKYTLCMEFLEEYQQLAKQSQVDLEISEAAAQLKRELEKIDVKEFEEAQQIGQGDEQEDWMDIQ